MSRQPAEAEPLITMAEVAVLLGVPLQTVRRWREHGQGPRGYRLGRHVMFRPSEVEAWLQSRREQQPLSAVRPVRGRRSA